MIILEKSQFPENGFTPFLEPVTFLISCNPGFQEIERELHQPSRIENIVFSNFNIEKKKNNQNNIIDENVLNMQLLIIYISVCMAAICSLLV